MTPFGVRLFSFFFFFVVLFFFCVCVCVHSFMQALLPVYRLYTGVQFLLLSVNFFFFVSHFLRP